MAWINWTNQALGDLQAIGDFIGRDTLTLLHRYLLIKCLRQ